MATFLDGLNCREVGGRFTTVRQKGDYLCIRQDLGVLAKKGAVRPVPSEKRVCSV